MAQNQTTNPDLRKLAKELFMVGVEAANPQNGLEKAFKAKPLLPLEGGRYLIIAFGKAALAMTQSCLKALPEGARFEALAVTNYENAKDAHMEGVTIHAAGHPVPDDNGLEAGRAIIDLLSTSTRHDRVIALISGGGSALVPAPIEGISLDDKIAVSELLLDNGYPIEQMNLVRQTLSNLKGGGLSHLAAPSPVTSYILSDVVGDDLSVIASGPTNPPLGTPKDALELFAAKNLSDKLPTNIINVLKSKRQTSTSHAQTANQTDDQADNQLIGSNRISLEAILDAVPEGWQAHIVNDQLKGDVGDVAPRLHAEAMRSPDGTKTALIWGGETTVTLRGDGLGGRNQELALRFAMLANKTPVPGTWAFLSGGTDGRDGPTDSAGGLVDAATITRLQQAGGDAEALLANNDSYKALKLSGDHLMIGATGTNVADIQICLVDRSNED